MIGSTLIKEIDIEKLKGFDPESAGDFLTIELETLLTLDFETKVSEAGLKWSACQPVFFDEERACVLFALTTTGLEFIASDNCQLEEHQKQDKALIRKFIQENGSDNIYEFATL